MRPFLATLKATALEVLSEPLTLLVLLAALALAVLAPTFHYHQFGDPTRMARDAGLSSLFLGGGVLAVFGTIRTLRREIESGTMEMALAHPISRTSFLLAKAAGAFVAYLAFALTVLGTSMVMFEGAAVGGIIASQTGDIARIARPELVAATGVVVVPLVVGAVLNRFFRFRFVLSSVTLALVLSIAASVTVSVGSRGDVLRLVPAGILLILPSAVFLAAAAAFAVRLKANAAAAATGLVFALALPAVGNYYLSDALSGGGVLPWSYVAAAAAAALPAVVAFLLLGTGFAEARDA